MALQLDSSMTTAMIYSILAVGAFACRAIAAYEVTSTYAEINSTAHLPEILSGTVTNITGEGV